MTEQELRKEVALFYNAIEMMGWDDLIFTPTSVGISGTDHFLIHQYGLMFNEITPENLVKIDIEGNVVDKGGSIALSSWYLHKAIHEARPEQNWVVHWHTPEVIALANDLRGVLPISQHALVVRSGGVVNHRYGGPVVMGSEYTDIQNLLASGANFMLMANHGATILANSPDEAFWNMYNLQMAAEVQVKSGESPILVDRPVEHHFNSKYEIFRKSIPDNGLWNAIKRKLYRLKQS
jgi:ribulose-5-phosphate 4-epimerase/fuculose-1-phosphate aldolase